jgi:hypothetical protein
LEPQDGGSADAPVSWEAAPGEFPVISGAAEYSRWQICNEPVIGSGSARLWEADVSTFSTHGKAINCLWKNGEFLPRAAVDFPLGRDESWLSRTRFTFAPSLLNCSAEHADAELHLTPQYVFVDNFLPVQILDTSKGRGETALPGYSELKPPETWAMVPGHCYLENVPEGLTQPGSWWFASQEARLLMVPFQDSEPPVVEIPILDELLVVQGSHDGKIPVRFLTIKGLTFTGCRRVDWPQDRQAIQHDWEIYDYPNALVRLRGVERLEIAQCRFQQSGGSGLRADIQATDVTIQDCEVHHLGGSGIVFCGDGIGGSDRCHHNKVLHNHIHHCGLLKADALGILLNQCGHSIVADNLIEQLPYCGIALVSGREPGFSDIAPQHGSDGGGLMASDFITRCINQTENRIGALTCCFNVVEHNEVRHVMQRLGDGNGIYVSGTGPGNIVRRNFVHHLEGAGCQSAIRLDDLQWSTLITENVVWKINGGGITLKHVNEIENNLIIECRRSGSILVRGGPAHGARVHRNLCVQFAKRMQSPGKVPPFYDDGGMGGDLSEPYLDQNFFCYLDGPEEATRFLLTMQERGQELNAVIVDLEGDRLDEGQFDFAPDSTPCRAGFRSIPSYGIRENHLS